MNRIKSAFCLIILMSALALAAPAYAELSGWIKSDLCWVVEGPSTSAKILGTIKKKTAVTAEDAGQGWLKLIFAPVRDPQTNKFIQCTGCFIQKKDFTTIPPGRW